MNSKEYQRRYYEANKEHVKQKHKAWRESNPDYSKEYHAANYKPGNAAKKERDKRNYKKNKEHYRAIAKQYRAENKEKVSARIAIYNKTVRGRYSRAKAIAKRRNISFELSLDEYTLKIGSGSCHYCGQELGETGGGLDRKNNEPTYNVNTVVACCYRCNSTFMAHYTYKEKLILAEAIKDIDILRSIKVPLPLV
jgi:hypothetical protein